MVLQTIHKKMQQKKKKIIKACLYTVTQYHTPFVRLKQAERRWLQLFDFEG